jgi:hypothetical protein
MGDSYKDAKRRYDEGGWNTDGFIQYVWNRIKDTAKSRENIPDQDHHIAERATKAFLNLYKVKAKPIYRIEILEEIKRVDGGFETYEGVGLWPWTENHSDVIKKEKGFYSIPNDDFYRALLKVILNVP